MKRVKQLRGWLIYELSKKERAEYNFNYAVIHPDVVGCGLLSPYDTDMEMDSLENAIDWILNY